MPSDGRYNEFANLIGFSKVGPIGKTKRDRKSIKKKRKQRKK